MNTTDEQGGTAAVETRFAFGENWKKYLTVVDDARILQAERSLQAMLGMSDLSGKRFLDIGSGSGLFSLAARRLGASVHSFDYDPQSVACTAELRNRYFRGDGSWFVEQGSILDNSYLDRLGHFDIVYSWGVLHHTGDMWTALANTVPTVGKDARLFIAIYNDQGIATKYWSAVKKIFNRGALGKLLMIALHAPYLVGARWIVRYLTDRLAVERGMTLWYDMIDWLGGYPFEVAKPEEIFRFFRDHGFALREMKTCGGRMGCNEYVFERITDPAQRSVAITSE